MDTNSIEMNNAHQSDINICSSCGKQNNAQAKFCNFCGNSLDSQNLDNSLVPAFSSVEESVGGSEPTAAEPSQELVAEEVENDTLAIFADGLPQWDIVPPQIMVRRR